MNNHVLNETDKMLVILSVRDRVCSALDRNHLLIAQENIDLLRRLGGNAHADQLQLWLNQQQEMSVN